MKFADDFLSKAIWCFLLCKLFLNNILSIFIYFFIFLLGKGRCKSATDMNSNFTGDDSASALDLNNYTFDSQ